MTNPDRDRPVLDGGAARRRRVDDLIARAERVASQPLRPRRSAWTHPAVVVAVAVLVLIVGVKLASGGSDGRTTRLTTVPTVIPTVLPTTSAPVVITFPPNPPTTVLPTTSAPTTSPATIPTTTAVTTTTWVRDPLAPVRWITFSAGVVHLQGAVPDSATSDLLASRFGAAFGAGNVSVEYVVTPAAPPVDDEPLFAHDVLQFAPNSADLDAVGTAFLDRLAGFLVANAAVTIDINGYTDSVGPDDSNLALSQSRVDAIAMYLVAQGVDMSRMTATGFGEASPTAGNDTEEGRALNRRVEFVLHHAAA